MKKYDSIIFDLDGTLWQTKESYIYAYHKLLENHPEIKSTLSDEFVTSTMGLTLDIVGEMVFGKIPNVEEIMHECLLYSCEYLLSHPSTISLETIQTLNILKKDYKLLIVSNCPKEYIDVFLNKLNSDIFISYKFLTEGTSKEENIKKLILENKLINPVFVGDSSFDYVASKKNNLDFIYLNSGYRKTEEYDYYIEKISDIKNILDNENKRLEILKYSTEYKEFKYYDAKVTIMKEKGTYLFGFWHYSNNDSYNQKLFDEVEKYVNTNKLIGPINLSTWFTYRLAIDNFDVSFIPDINNKKEQVDFLINRGYVINQRYKSSVAKYDEKLHKRVKRINLNSKYTIHIYQNNKCLEHIKEIYEISIDAFSDAYLYKNISYEDFNNLYVDGFKCPNPDLIIIKYEDEAIAFSLCYDDPINKLYVSKTVALKKKFQDGKVIGKIVDICYDMMLQKGFENALYHFKNESNNNFNAMIRNYLIYEKHYALFERKKNEN